jgi:hypothetical protein
MWTDIYRSISSWEFFRDKSTDKEHKPDENPVEETATQAKYMSPEEKDAILDRYEQKSKTYTWSAKNMIENLKWEVEDDIAVVDTREEDYGSIREAIGAYIDEDGNLRFAGKEEREEYNWLKIFIIKTQKDLDNLMKVLDERGLIWADLQDFPLNKWLWSTIKISNRNPNYGWPKSGVDPIIYVPPSKKKTY